MPPSNSPFNDAWLLQVTDIRHALSDLTHPHCQVSLRKNGEAMGLRVRMLGLDARSLIFFWRLADEHADMLADEAALGRLAGQPLDFQGITSDQRNMMQFRAGPSNFVQFSDRSLLMITPFPQDLRQFKLDG